MRVAMIISGLGVGGAETSLANIVQNLDAGFEPFVISLSDVGEVGERIRRAGIPVDALETRSALTVPRTFIRLVRRLREIRPDIVHTWMYHADFLGGLAARVARVPAVAWSIHASNLEAGKLKTTTRLLVRACGLLSRAIPTTIVCCSRAAIGVHLQHGYAKERIVVIPNGIDTSRFRPDPSARESVRRELGCPPDARLAGFIGRYDIQKNVPGFFEAAGVVHRDAPGVHFVLAGSGIDANNAVLVQAAEKAGVQSVTHMLGGRNDVPRLMAALDVLVSSSDGEAFPLVLGEAMACGIPCAVTDVGDSAYIVGDTGAVVRAGDMGALAHAVQTLLALSAVERERLGDRARARIAENFEMSAVLKRYQQAYESAVRAASA